jgi:mono/diheme cytochrome c family protein
MKTAFRSTTDEERSMMTLRLAFAGIAMITAAMSASAADIDQGRKLASQWCSNCHVVAPDQARGGDSAPPFVAIAETAAGRSGDLRAWMADPHPPMPNLDLTVREIDDLLAYIESLSGD